MSIDQRNDCGGAKVFAYDNHICIRKFMAMANTKGLTALGLQKIEHSVLKPITYGHLREWNSMTQSQRDEKGGAAGYALKQNIAVSSFTYYAQNSGLRLLGRQRLFPASATRVMPRHLTEWQSMTAEERKDIGGITGYAEENKIKLSNWRSMVTTDGLNKLGEKRLIQMKEFSAICSSSRSLIKEFNQLPNQPRSKLP